MKEGVDGKDEFTFVIKVQIKQFSLINAFTARAHLAIVERCDRSDATL